MSVGVAGHSLDAGALGSKTPGGILARVAKGAGEADRSGWAGCPTVVGLKLR